MTTCSKKVLTCTVAFLVIGVISGCDTKLNEGAVTPKTDSTDDVMVATAEQFQGYAKFHDEEQQ